MVYSWSNFSHTRVFCLRPFSFSSKIEKHTHRWRSYILTGYRLLPVSGFKICNCGVHSWSECSKPKSAKQRGWGITVYVFGRVNRIKLQTSWLVTLATIWSTHSQLSVLPPSIKVFILYVNGPDAKWCSQWSACRSKCGKERLTQTKAPEHWIPSLNLSVCFSHLIIKAERVAEARTHFVCCAGEAADALVCAHGTHLLCEWVAQRCSRPDTDLYGATSFLELTNDALHPVVAADHHGDPVTQLRLRGRGQGCGTGKCETWPNDVLHVDKLTNQYFIPFF